MAKNFNSKFKIFLSFLFHFFLFHAFSQSDPNIIGRRFLDRHAKTIGFTEDELRNTLISDSYFDNTTGAQLVYAQQSFKDIPIYNQLQVLAFKNDACVSNKGGRIRGFEQRTNGLAGIPSISATEAVKDALRDRKIPFSGEPIVIGSEQNGRFVKFNDMGVSRESITAQLMWVPLETEKKVVLAWQIYIVSAFSSDYWMVRVNAMDHSISGVTNLTVTCHWGDPAKKLQPNYENTVLEKEFHIPFLTSSLLGDKVENVSPSIINNATYRVIPYPAESPIHPGGDHDLVSNPWSAVSGNATSLKWHNNGTFNYTITRGNNVFAQEDINGDNLPGNTATSSSFDDPLLFDFTPNFSVPPTQPGPNQQFAITNLFYWNNIVHDLSYLYGFDETAGNFQTSNQGRGGLGNDHVVADAQDGAGTDNANFATPPDGSSGRMQMYLWGSGPVKKDGDLDNGVISHEFAHGISNRLTGGPSQAGCLQNREQMGEGWSDYFGLMYTQNWATSNINTGFTTPRAVGVYASGQSLSGQGIRTKRYCTNFSINNLVFGASLSSQQHTRGELWCATLWDMTWNIIKQTNAINSNLYDVNGNGGNSIALKLVMTGMKLQPCNPGFIDARDAIIQADRILYNGAYNCAIREAFSRRGMGNLASQGSSDNLNDQTSDYTLDCCVNVSITSQPQNVNACVGANASFSVQALGTAATYQWQVSTNSGASFSNIPNATNATLILNAVNISLNNYRYRVVVSSSCPSTDTSAPATLSVNTPASISTQPSPQTICAGGNVSFSVSASGSANLYQWQQSTNGGQSYSNVQGASLQSYTINNTIALQNNNLYRVIIASCEPTPDTSISVLLTVNSPAGITTQPSPKGACPNGSTQFSMVASGTDPRYQWQLSTNGGTSFNDIAGESNAQLNLTNIPLSHTNYLYRVSVTTTICPGTVISDSALLIVDKNPQILTQPTNKNICPPNNVSFSVNAIGSELTYQWQLSTDQGATFTDIPGQTSAILSINTTSVSMNDNRYRVYVRTNCSGSDTLFSSLVKLRVYNPATILTQPSLQRKCSGDRATFNVSASGDGVSRQWQVSTDGGSTYSELSGENNPTLVLDNINPYLNNNLYRMAATVIECGTVYSDGVLLTVVIPAKVIQQPSDINVCSGQAALFTTSSEGTELSYQWQERIHTASNFSNIDQALNPEYSITNTSLTMNNHEFRLIVKEATCGYDTSDVVKLEVRETPVANIGTLKTTLFPYDSTTIKIINKPITTDSIKWYAGQSEQIGFRNKDSIIAKVLNATTYTAEIISTNGCSSKSAPITLRDTATAIQLFPNPNNGNFQIRMDENINGRTSRSVKIYDGRGRKVFDKTFEIVINNQMVNISMNLVSFGLYYMEIVDESGKTIKKGKLIIQ